MIKTPQPVSKKRQALLSRVGRILECQTCEEKYEPEAESDGSQVWRCSKCRKYATVADSAFVFAAFPKDVSSDDWLNRIKNRAKHLLGHLYPLAIRAISPVCGRRMVNPFLKTFILETQLVADLGSGTSQYGDKVVCVDGTAYPNCHVVAMLNSLPIADESFDGIISMAVLEHVPNPESHVREMHRVLKIGGRILCFIPFMQGFHASPDDYQRYTKNGVRELFRDFEVLRVEVGAGPTSGMLWILQEWLALTLSCGSSRGYRLLVPVTWILSPLKWLDLLLMNHPDAHVIASGFVIEARKLPKGV